MGVVYVKNYALKVQEYGTSGLDKMVHGYISQRTLIHVYFARNVWERALFMRLL